MTICKSKKIGYYTQFFTSKVSESVTEPNLICNKFVRRYAETPQQGMHISLKTKECFQKVLRTKSFSILSFYPVPFTIEIMASTSVGTFDNHK